MPHGRSEDLNLPVSMVDTMCYTHFWLLQNCAVSVLSPVVATSYLQVQHLRYGWWDEQLVFKQLFSVNYI